MSAKEMFKELGFELEEQTDTFIVYACYEDDDTCYVCFELNEHYFQCFYNPEYTMYSQPLEVNMQLQNAINKQIEELEW